jgi:hypothetical protein
VFAKNRRAVEDYDAEIDAADDAYGLDLAGAMLTWTTDVVGEETTFLCQEATGRKDLIVAIAGFDKTYKINRRLSGSGFKY